MPTHEVLNQPPPLEGHNVYLTDRPLMEGLAREGGAWAEERLVRYGEILGRPETIRLGVLANRFPPELRTHDRYGHRIDEVDFHPAWHEMMRLGMANELHNLPWREPRHGANVARSALNYMHTQVEAGSNCPITMTYAAMPTLRHQEDVLAEWEPRLLATEYDPRMTPPERKSAVLIGMAMTEKQGGSDVRANTTTAVPVDGGGPGGAYEITGHKWFCSAPMCDAFLTLAHTDAGLSCFLVPRWRPDGTRNGFHIQRLKDKLGNRSNASSEIEYAGAWGRMIGEDGRGVRTIIDMVHHTRLDCVSGSAGIMRQAVAQAIHHASHRSAFGRLLTGQPLMQNVLADLAVESEAATVLMVRLARAYDDGLEHEGARAFARIATAAAKFWVCKRAPHLTYEAMECLGGNGYAEESMMPRLYREAPVNAIWEGSGNVICLDVLRAITREPDSLPALLDELRTARGGNARYDAELARFETDILDGENVETRSRTLTSSMAVLLQASLLLRHAPSFVADAFCASRLGQGGTLVFGTLAAGTRCKEIVERAAPTA
ncbi:MAG: isovaleryl-CoA dehydrogenase [Candidatus Binatia bacterium]